MGKIEVQYNLAGIKGLCLIMPKVYNDSRGFLLKPIINKI